jgi:signal transduction histidine kinase
VLGNLVENAARFSPDEAAQVRATGRSRRRRPKVGAFEVLDEGPGIPPEALTRVFERFYRTDEARSTDDGGSGLGLAIARWIVELHGGTIRAENLRPAGCRLAVRIPT